MPYSLQLPGYSIGESAYEEIDAIVSSYGSSVVVIGGKTALEKSRPRLEDALAHSGIEVVDWVFMDITAPTSVSTPCAICLQCSKPT